MIDRPILSDDGERRCQGILQIAIEEGAKRRKRRRIGHAVGVSTALGFVFLAVLMLNSARRGEQHNRPIAGGQHPASPNAQLIDTTFSSIHFSLVSSNTTSVEKYIVRTSEVHQPVTLLDEGQLIKSALDSSLGVARIGDRFWLVRDDGTLIAAN